MNLEITNGTTSIDPCTAANLLFFGSSCRRRPSQAAQEFQAKTLTRAVAVEVIGGHMAAQYHGIHGHGPS